MASANIMELELKFYAGKDYVPELLAAGYAEKKQRSQKDEYYLSDDKINGVRTWLRLREDKGSGTASIALHQLVSEYATDETEISILPADIAKMNKILAVLGLGIKCGVDKQRRIYEKGDICITLDRIAGLGDFIEIELMATETAENIGRLNAVVVSLGLNPDEHINEGYPELLMRKADA